MMQKLVAAFLLMSLAGGLAACASDPSFANRDSTPIIQHHGPDSGGKH